MFRKRRRDISEGQAQRATPTNIKLRVRNYSMVIGVILLIAISFALPHRIIIKSITCTSQNGECSQRIKNGIGQYVGMTLPASQRSVRDFLTHELVSKEMTIRYKYPSTLAISVIETKPVFALSNNDENNFRLLDTEGNVLSEANETNMPYANISGDLPAVGTKVNEGYVFTLGLLSDLSSSYQISKGELTDAGLLVELPTKTKVLFPLEGDRELLLGSFILVINQLNSVKVGSTMEKVEINGKTLDLRYKNPVIR
jgi:hypothetical protein